MVDYNNTISVSKEKLQDFYYNHPNKVVCAFLKCSNQTLMKVLDKQGIPRKGKGNRDTKQDKWIRVF